MKVGDRLVGDASQLLRVGNASGERGEELFRAREQIEVTSNVAHL
jgi:hypothetical protein